MKRFFNLFAAMVVALALGGNVANAATDPVAWGYSGNDIIGGVGAESGVSGGAIYIPEEVAQLYKGMKVVGLNIGLGSNVTDLDAFVTPVLGSDDEYYLSTYKEELGDDWNQVYFYDTYTIDGSAFYVGYTAKGKKPVGFGRMSNPNAHWVTTNGTDWESREKSNALTIRLLIEDDNAIPNDLAIVKVDNVIVNPGQPYSISFSTLNQSAISVKNFEVEYTVGDGAAKTCQFKQVQARGSEHTYSIDVTDVVASESTLPISVKVTKVNGSADKVTANNEGKSALVCTTREFPRRLVIEEITATWCGYCAAALLASEKMATNYPGKYISVAVHTGDSYVAESYAPLYTRTSGTPKAYANRVLLNQPGYEIYEQSMLSNCMAPAIANVKLYAGMDLSESTSTVKVNAQIEFAAGEEDANYTLSYVLIDGGVYAEQSGYGLMNYPDLAREIYGFTGFDVIPTSIAQYEFVEDMRDLTLPSTVTIMGTSYYSNLKMIVFLINKRTGEIMNAAQCPIDLNQYPSGVETVADSNLGDVHYNGYSFVGAEGIRVFAVNGVEVANSNLTPGIYVVKAQGMAKKCVVK